MTRIKRKHTQVPRQREVDSDTDSNHEAAMNKKRKKGGKLSHITLKTKASASFVSLPAEVRNMIYVLVFDQGLNVKMSIIRTGRYVKHRAAFMMVNRQINDETRGWLFTWPLRFNSMFELREALERMTPSDRSKLQFITIRDSINLQTWGRETSLVKSAGLLRDAVKSLKVLRFEYWPEKSLRDHEVAESIYRNTEPLLTAIGEARGAFDAALEVTQFQLAPSGFKKNYHGDPVSLYANRIWHPHYKCWHEGSIREYLRKKLCVDDARRLAALSVSWIAKPKPSDKGESIS